jgi:hypothetical protein
VGLAALLVLGLALRVPMAWRFRVDSDEPQHLHVVWAWTHGLLPYRDVFDNHMPLFHLLSAPVLLAVGERPTAILWMRFLMLPQWCAALLLTALIGRRLFAPRVGAWSAVLAGFYPLFFFCSLEYRPDVLWTVLWLSAILIAIDGAPTVRRGLALGLVLGTAAAVSLKTILLLNGSVRLGEAGKTVAFQTDVLGLVRAGEPVMDPKGDAVFRPRAIYWVLEGVTKARLRTGLLADDFAGRLVREHVRVVAGNSENLPVGTRRWVRAHYLRVARYAGVGGTLVAGARFDAVRGGFEVGIPALYVIVDRSGSARGLLDGRPYGSPRRLRPGFHSYRPAPGEPPAAALWSNAAERGFSPFDAEGNWQ